MRFLGLLLLVGCLTGCTRGFYHRQADRESYGAIEERDHDPRWDLPHIGIDPPPESRLHDPASQDFPPLPPDDPAAHRYMRCVNCIPGYRRWTKNGLIDRIEDPEWRNSLRLSDDGVLQLTPDRAVELGLLHSREYQTQLENLYLVALSLTLNRFEFTLHWFGTNDTSFTHFGSSADELNTLKSTSMLGFTRAFASGGQLMVDVANNIVFQFAGPDTTNITSNIAIQLIQPLLRGAGRNVRLEPLTEAERQLLYQVREFAHFRKQYTFDVATNTYLTLLFQEQNIRNLKATVTQLEQSYRLHQALLAAGGVGGVTEVKVDQVFQDLLQRRFALIQAEAALETAYDRYKNTLGLPPSLPIHLDDSLLNPFQLNSTALTTEQEELEKLETAFRELDQPPPLVKLEEGYKQVQNFHGRTLALVKEVQGEFDHWRDQPADPEQTQELAERERAAKTARARDLEELRDDLQKLGKQIAEALPGVVEGKRTEAWHTLQRLIRDETAGLSQLYVIQAQIRVYLIRLRPVHYDLAQAVDYAKANRLDLMNQRGRVVDAWRQIDVAANALEAGFDLVLNANIATPPIGKNPVDFRASASSYSIGFHFDGPLNREVARNVFRTSQINYEQARRAFMALEDNIERSIRNDLRQLNTERLNFEIARQSLIAAARQVEQSREALLTSDNPDPTSTQNILQAINSVLTAKNTLIGSFINFETARYQVLLDLEALQLDDRGLYRDEHDLFPNQSSAGDRGQPQSPAEPTRP